MSSMNCT